MRALACTRRSGLRGGRRTGACSQTATLIGDRLPSFLCTTNTVNNNRSSPREMTVRVEICYSADDAYAGMLRRMVEHNGDGTAEAIECAPRQVRRSRTGLLRRCFIRNHRRCYLHTPWGRAVVEVVQRGETEGRESMEAEGQASRLYVGEPVLWRERGRITPPVSRPRCPQSSPGHPRPPLLRPPVQPAPSHRQPSHASGNRSAVLSFPLAPFRTMQTELYSGLGDLLWMGHDVVMV